MNVRVKFIRHVDDSFTLHTSRALNTFCFFSRCISDNNYISIRYADILLGFIHDGYRLNDVSRFSAIKRYLWWIFKLFYVKINENDFPRRAKFLFWHRYLWLKTCLKYI